ncbi:hypothetical protein KSS87_009781 [Heliosperma pusillum]|nr:hypothetical protein KSS87_009781 [Heliosperma pusillum]
MGASSSKNGEIQSNEVRDLEAQAVSNGVLSILRTFFSKLSDADSVSLSSLQQCFSLNYANISCETGSLPECFPGVLEHMGAAITDTLFPSNCQEGGGITWVDFLRGYVRCCGRMPASSLLNILFRVLALAAQRAGSAMKLEFDSEEFDGKASGSISPQDLGIILWVCWIMSSNPPRESQDVSLPDVSHLVLSAVESCADNASAIDLWGSDILSLEPELTVGKIHTWAIRTVPNLTDCFSHFITSRMKQDSSSESNGAGTSSTLAENGSDATRSESYLLTRGRAWALFLSQRSSISDHILKICFPCNDDVIEESLLYRSRVHGKGLNRFWLNVDGYHGPVLVLVSATSGESSENSRKWIIGALTHQGFENRDVFYGSGGCLYSIDPTFHVFSAAGSEQNYMYSHLHPAMRAYDPHPKPVGIAFGGSAGNERVFIDDDFAKVTVRHHALDKTYQHGSLFPNQGYLPVEASVLDVEVWGLGGKATKEVQISYQKREDLFTAQRRTIDLKTFTNWEDSPEKMMMDMMSNPNTVRREDR